MLDNNYHILWMIVAVALPVFIFNFKCFSFLDGDVKHVGRNYNIDALRYFLAAFVAMHHFSLTINFIKSGLWLYPRGHDLDAFIGNFAVCIFFMISAYLFWGRCSNDDTNWFKVLIGRLFRIGPMFLVSAILCWLLAYKFGVRNETTFFSERSTYHWFDMGLTDIRPDIFGFKDTRLLNAGVMWTLPYEWMFYFSLPALSLFVKKKNSIAVIFAVIFITFYFLKDIDKLTVALLAMFAMGALTYELKSKINFEVHKIKMSMISSLLLIISGFLFIKQDSISLEASLVYACFFFSVCIGGNPFLALGTKGARRLGEISFSLYLLHGVVWYLFGRFMLKFDMTGHVFLYYILASLAFVISCLLSAFTYHFFEAKMISIGRKVQSRIF